MIAYESRNDCDPRPSWPGFELYLNEEHSQIFQETSALQGWQAEGDTYKLYEMAHFLGDVILEIGVHAGRSAVVQLRGAYSNPERTTVQFFGVDTDPRAIPRSRRVLREHGFGDQALLFCGNLRDFAKRFPITPTMVFLDGDHTYSGVWKDLEVLSQMLSAGTPLLCHDFTNKENRNGSYGVRKACDEWEERGFLRFLGVFGCSALYETTAMCSKPRGGLAPEVFAQGCRRSPYSWARSLSYWLDQLKECLVSLQS